MSSEGNTEYGRSQVPTQESEQNADPGIPGAERTPSVWDVPAAPSEPEPYLGSSIAPSMDVPSEPIPGSPMPGSPIPGSPSGQDFQPGGHDPWSQLHANPPGHGSGYAAAEPNSGSGYGAEPVPGYGADAPVGQSEPVNQGATGTFTGSQGHGAQNPETGWNTPNQPPPSFSSGWQPPTPPASSSGGQSSSSSPKMIGVAIVVAALVGALAGYLTSNAKSGNGQVTIVKQFSPNTSTLARMSDPQSVIQKVIPALVSIDTKSVQTTSNPFGFGSSPFGGGGGTSVVSGAGTGMIITSDGEVITNNHVVAGATTVSVTLYGQTKSIPATIVGTDPAEDLALIKIQNVSNLPTITWGDSNNLQVGDSVLAIGNALDLGGGLSVTEGIVSAKNRSIQAGDATSSSTENLNGLIQTDAAINSGNSGGALVTSNGQVVGMNTAVASSTSGNAPAQNVGFAIASDHIQQFIPQLQKGGTITTASGTAYMGVELVSVDPQIQQQFGITASSGAFVAQVVAGSPADQAGIRGGDVITSIDGQTVSAASDVSSIIQNDKPGQKISVQLQRGSNQMTVQLTLGTAPSS